MDRLRIGFVGAGYMGQLAHIANYVGLPGVELAALAEGRPQLAEQVAARYGIGRVFPDHRALLAEAEVEAVVAIMPFSLHHAVVPDLLAAGKHVLTEKPITVQPESARKLADQAAAQGLVYQVGYQKRSDPAAVYAKRLAEQWRESGECGALRYLRASMPPGPWQMRIEPPIGTGEPFPSYPGETAEPPPAWMDEQTGKLFISFINYYIHQVNLMRYLLGEDYRIRYADPAGVTFTATSESGVPCVLEMSPYATRNHWVETYTLCFAQGYLELSLPAPLARQQCGRVRVFRGTGEHDSFEQPVLPPLWQFAQQARNFAAAASGQAPNIAPAAEAAKDLETAEEYLRVWLEARG